MKKKLSHFLIITITISIFIPSMVFASDTINISDLDVPDLNVTESNLKEQYANALKGLESQGFGKKSNTTTATTIPEGFGKTVDNAESLFKNIYGDMWEDKTFNTDLLSKGTEGKLSDEEFDSYVGNLTSQYQTIYNSALADDVADFQSKYTSSFNCSNKWASSMMSIDEAKKTYAFKSDSELQSFLNNSQKPDGYDRIKSTTLADLEASNQLKPNENIFSKALDSILDMVNNTDSGAMSTVNGLIDDQKQSDDETYDNYYNSYFYQKGGGTSIEQNEQRKEILSVLEENGIYDRDSSDESATDEEYIGKLIYDNMDLLKKEIPDLKAY